MYQTDDQIIEQALSILAARLRQPGQAISSPKDSKNYLVLRLAELEHEVFSVLFLDNQNRVLAYEEMFRGTIDQASVYPREVVKRALTLNAAAIIFAHNHPSGNSEPSHSDCQLTDRLVSALGLLDVRVLDHIIVGNTGTCSMSERGLL